MSCPAPRALLCAAAVVSALAVGAFTDLSPAHGVAREIGPARVAPIEPAPSVLDQDRLARVGAVILLGLEWSRR